jgi:hypothetical protein
MFSAQGANLDIIELAAIYWWLPSTFLNDDNGRKEQYRKAIEMNLKEMYRDKENGNLVGAKLRNAVYRNVSPLHGHRESMYVDIRSSIVNTFSSAWSKGGISDEGNAWEDVEDQESSRASSSSRGSNSTGTMTLEERKRALTNKLYNPKTNAQKYVPPSRTARLGQQPDKAASEETSRTSVDVLTMEERRRRLTQSRRFSDKPSAADTAVGKATTNPLHSDGSSSNEGGDDSSTGAPGLHNTL